jgi:hypothetical protein
MWCLERSLNSDWTVAAQPLGHLSNGLIATLANTMVCTESIVWERDPLGGYQ